MRENKDVIIKENSKDVELGKSKGLSASLIDRLLLNEKRIDEMINGLKEVAAMKDDLGNI
jgi:glutamate-5-semialdehyde dehydrogenase